MTDLEANMPVESPDTGIVERDQQMGRSSILQTAKGWLESGRRIASAYGAAGTLAVGGSAALLVEGLDVSSSSAAETQGLIHGTSSMTTQDVLNDIRHVVMPCNPLSGCVKWLRNSNMADIYPTYAYATGSSGGFRANCDEKNSYFTAWYETTAGRTYGTCQTIGGQVVPNLHYKTGQNQKGINALVKKEEASVIQPDSSKAIVLDKNEVVKYDRGNRQKVTAQLECPKGVSSTTSTANAKAYIKSIVFTNAYRTEKGQTSNTKQQYSRVTITLC